MPGAIDFFSLIFNHFYTFFFGKLPPWMPPMFPLILICRARIRLPRERQFCDLYYESCTCNYGCRPVLFDCTTGLHVLNSNGRRSYSGSIEIWFPVAFLFGAFTRTPSLLYKSSV